MGRPPHLRFLRRQGGRSWFGAVCGPSVAGLGRFEHGRHRVEGALLTRVRPEYGRNGPRGAPAQHADGVGFGGLPLCWPAAEEHPNENWRYAVAVQVGAIRSGVVRVVEVVPQIVRQCEQVALTEPDTTRSGPAGRCGRSGPCGDWGPRPRGRRPSSARTPRWRCWTRRPRPTGSASHPLLAPVFAVAGCDATADNRWPRFQVRSEGPEPQRQGILAARCRARGVGRGP
jgi:hypothetical protein